MGTRPGLRSGVSRLMTEEYLAYAERGDIGLLTRTSYNEVDCDDHRAAWAVVAGLIERQQIAQAVEWSRRLARTKALGVVESRAPLAALRPYLMAREEEKRWRPTTEYTCPHCGETTVVREDCGVRATIICMGCLGSGTHYAETPQPAREEGESADVLPTKSATDIGPKSSK